MLPPLPHKVKLFIAFECAAGCNIRVIIYIFRRTYMAVRRLEKRTTYDSKGRKAEMAPLVIDATRNPTTSDFAAIGTIWVNSSTATIYGLAKIASGVATWTTSPASELGVFTSVQVTTGDLDIDAAGSTTTINSGTINFSNGASVMSLAGDLIVGGKTTLSGDVDITTASLFDITANGGQDPAILLETDGAVTETIQIINTQGTADDSIELRGVAGGVKISSGEATSTAIKLDSYHADGGVTIEAGSGGILLGNQEDCTTIDIGDTAPTTSRTISVGGGTVVTAAVTDTIDIGPDGATTNANSIKTVNVNTGGVTLGEVLTNIASGTITSGTHTVSIQSGNAAAGTVATNISTGTGTKIVNVGNADGLTTFNLDGITNINDDINVATQINTGTSTGAVTIGNAAAGNIGIDTAGTVLVDADGVVEINSSAGIIGIGNDADANNINIGTGAAARSIAIGNVTGATDISIDGGTGGIDINSAGIVSMTPGTGTVSGVAITLNSRVGKALFSAQTPAAGATIDFDITNLYAAADKTILVTMSYSGAADCDITLEGVNMATAGHINLHCKNNGAAQGNGNIVASWWILD